MRTEFFKYTDSKGQVVFVLKDLVSGNILKASKDQDSIFEYDRTLRFYFNIEKNFKKVA